MEKVIGDIKGTLLSCYATVAGPVEAVVEKNLPGFGYKVLGVVGLLIGYNISVMYVTSRTEASMFLEKMRLYALGDDLVKRGFFVSDAEDAESRHHDYTHTTER